MPVLMPVPLLMSVCACVCDQAREKFEQATRRLKTETAAVEDLVDRREFAYSSFLVASADAFLPSAAPLPVSSSLEPGGEEGHRGAGAAGGAAGGGAAGSTATATATATATIKGIIPSGETLAHMTSSATSTATAASGWMSSRLSCKCSACVRSIGLSLSFSLLLCLCQSLSLCGT